MPFTHRVADRRRILVSVVPRLLSDSLAELLRDLDLDDVVIDGAELPPGHYDAAIVSLPHGTIDTPLLIEVHADGESERRSGAWRDPRALSTQPSEDPGVSFES